MNIDYFYWNDYYWDFIVINYNTRILHEMRYTMRTPMGCFKLLCPLKSVNTYKLFLIAISQMADNNFSFIYKKKRKNSIKVLCY